MAPAVFTSLRQHDDAARVVLDAWTSWSVFAPSFLKELEACFEGREIIKLTPAANKDDTIEEGN